MHERPVSRNRARTVNVWLSVMLDKELAAEFDPISVRRIDSSADHDLAWRARGLRDVWLRSFCQIGRLAS